MMDLAVASLTMAGLALLMLLINLPFYRRPRSSPTPAAFSVLIPARNEERNIADAVACVLANEGVEIELLVLDDHSTDRTRDILASVDDPRLRVIEGSTLPAGWSGKQHACAALAREARHALMVFVDADVRLSVDALLRVAGFMQRHPAIALASGFPRQITVGWSERLLLPLIHVMLLCYLPIPLGMLLRAPSLGAGCGQLFVARRDAYHAAGGHGAIRASRHDGITLPRAFRKAGFGTGLFDATGLASCRMYETAALLWEGLTKNATEGMATTAGLPIWTLLLGLGHIAPAVLVVLVPDRVTLAAYGAGLLIRLILALRFKQSFVGVLLHPISVAALLAVQWASLFRAWRGAPSTWRGRAYPTG